MAATHESRRPRRPRRSTALAAVAVLPLLALAACGGDEEGGDGGDGGDVTLSLAHSYTETQPQHRCGAQVIADEVAAADVGMEVEIFWRSSAAFAMFSVARSMLATASTAWAAVVSSTPISMSLMIMFVCSVYVLM